MPVAILLLKKAAKEFLLGSWLDGLDVEPLHKEKARSVFASFQSARTQYLNYEGDPVADTTYQANWKESSVLIFSLIDDLVYNNTFDERYKNAAKNYYEFSDVVEYPSVKERMDEINDKIVLEREAAAPTAASAAATEAVPQTTYFGESAGSEAASAAGAPPLPPKPSEVKGFEQLSEDDRQHWTKHINKAIRSTVKLIADDGTAASLAEKVAGCDLAMARGDATGMVLFHFDVKKYGESNTRPDIRISPMRDQPYQRLVSTVLQARVREPVDGAEDNEAVGLGPAEIAMLLDGGKPGNKSRLLGPWRAAEKKKGKGDDDAPADVDVEDEEDRADKSFVPSLLQIVKTEKSILERKKLLRGTGTMSVKQLESCHVASHSRISLPERNWTHYPGSNVGDTLVGVELPALDHWSVWRETWKTKKEIYGKKHLILAGGKTEGVSSKSGPAQARTDATVEPVCWHPMPLAFYEDVINGFFVKLIFDLTAVDAMFAWQAILSRTGYVGITFTEKGAEHIYERLFQLMVVHMAEVGHPRYDANYAAAVKNEKPRIHDEKMEGRD